MNSIIDLFSGVGGLSLGAVHSGLDLVGAVELDKIASETHQINFPNVNHLTADVSELKGIRLLKTFNQSEIYGLIGGPPCQGFSSIGKRDINDPRNQLFIHFFRLVSETKPVFFLAENVKGILHSKYKTIVNKAFNYVEKDYSMLPPIELNAKDLGVPTSRTRIFFIGVRKDIKHSLNTSIFTQINYNKVTVLEAFNGLESESLYIGDSRNKAHNWVSLSAIKKGSYAEKISSLSYDKVGNDYSKDRYFSNKEITGMIGTAHSPEVLKRFSHLLPGQTDKISRCTKLDPNGFCPTLRAGTSSENGGYQAVRPIHPLHNRVITPREAARIQGFPDWFLFHPTKWHSFKQIGNSVSPLMGKIILEIIHNHLEEKNYG
jgi:DNA (cytosine-5)-methyltransferase 1